VDLNIMGVSVFYVVSSIDFSWKEERERGRKVVL
jgi:hypothetical protein